MPLELIGARARAGAWSRGNDIHGCTQNNCTLYDIDLFCFCFLFLDLEYVKRRFGALLIFGELWAEEWANEEYIYIYIFFFG